MTVYAVNALSISLIANQFLRVNAARMPLVHTLCLTRTCKELIEKICTFKTAKTPQNGTK
jgi:hypothetical protein